MLQEVLGRMPEEEARGYLKKCIDSGLWIPNAQDAQAQAKGGDSTSQEETSDEEQYERVAEEVDKWNHMESLMINGGFMLYITEF